MARCCGFAVQRVLDMVRRALPRGVLRTRLTVLSTLNICSERSLQCNDCTVGLLSAVNHFGIDIKALQVRGQPIYFLLLFLEMSVEMINSYSGRRGFCLIL